MTSVLGTRLHLRLEAFLNNKTLADDGLTDIEWPTLVHKLVHMAVERKWQPFRTELSVFYEANAPHDSIDDVVVPCAGQIDCLFRDEDGRLVIVDLKRTDKKLDDDEPPYGHKRCAAPMENEWASDFNKYSLQISMYSVMLKNQLGIEVGEENRFLLQVHPSMEEAKLIKCKCFDSEATSILNCLSIL